METQQDNRPLSLLSEVLYSYLNELFLSLPFGSLLFLLENRLAFLLVTLGSYWGCHYECVRLSCPLLQKNKKKKWEKRDDRALDVQCLRVRVGSRQLQYRMFNARKLNKSNISTIKKICFLFLHLLPILALLCTLKRAKYSEDGNDRERVLHGKGLLSYQICSITNYSISS